MPTTRNSDFDYTLAIHSLCRDICSKVKEFRLIDTDKIGYSLVNTRTDGRYGVWASIRPLRFQNGAQVTTRRVTRYNLWGVARCYETRYYKLPKYIGPNGSALLYIFSIMGNRFIDLSIREKLDTVMHELYHINPQFNGDVRRFPGRNWQHGNKVAYDAIAAKFTDEWLASNPDERLYEFLKYDMRRLRENFGKVTGDRYKLPRMIQISQEEAFKLEPDLGTKRRAARSYNCE